MGSQKFRYWKSLELWNIETLELIIAQSRINKQSIIFALMKHLLITGIASLLSFTASAQMLLDTVWFTRNWQQSTRDSAFYYRLVYADTSGKIRFIVRDYYPGGTLQMEGFYRSINPDIKDGHFLYYYPDGSKKLECTFNGNQVDGMLTEWHPNGALKLQVGYRNGKYHGIFLQLDTSGIPILSANYRDGELHGKFISYYPNGQKVREDVYSKGILKKKRCYTRDGKDTAWFPYLALPEFPGGRSKFQEFIDEHLIYPAEALAGKLQGSVELEVQVGKDGRLFNIRVVDSPRQDFAEEAVRVLSSSPPWKPGCKDGQPIEMTIHIPIKFRIKQSFP